MRLYASPRHGRCRKGDFMRVRGSNLNAIDARMISQQWEPDAV